MPEAKLIQRGEETGHITGPWRPIEGDYLEDQANGLMAKITKCVWKGNILYCYITQPK